MRNSEYDATDVRRVCERKLGITFRRAGELNGWYEHQGRRVARITVPQGRKFLPPKTYKSMATQLKLTVDDFDRLLDCSLTAEEYAQKIATFLAT